MTFRQGIPSDSESFPFNNVFNMFLVLNSRSNGMKLTFMDELWANQQRTLLAKLQREKSKGGVCPGGGAKLGPM